jgi:UDP-N-acetylmuramoyl-tripeptide--D-alanyl-D-alanine ligase
MTFVLPLFGKFQIYNFLAAYAAFKTLGYNLAGINTSTIKFETAPMRGQYVNLHGVNFISDCYNANPESVKAGLVSFAEQKTTQRRLIILGDMLELGSNEKRLHREVGQLLALQAFDLVALVGPRSKFIKDELIKAGVDLEKIWYFTNARTCADKMVKNFTKGDLVYIKGSRGIGLEIVMDIWKDKGGQA